VLVVDDNVDIAELLSEALQMYGFETCIAYDGRSALESWRSFVPHAAVLDVGLPDVDGYDLARSLRAEHGSTPTLIAATGYGQRTDRLRAVDAGFDCHFVKPVSIQDLVHALDKRVVTAG
jgi:DNA-binding response OmpR family regulator